MKKVISLILLVLPLSVLSSCGTTEVVEETSYASVKLTSEDSKDLKKMVKDFKVLTQNIKEFDSSNVKDSTKISRSLNKLYADFINVDQENLLTEEMDTLLLSDSSEVSVLSSAKSGEKYNRNLNSVELAERTDALNYYLLAYAKIITESVQDAEELHIQLKKELLPKLEKEDSTASTTEYNNSTTSSSSEVEHTSYSFKFGLNEKAEFTKDGNDQAVASIKITEASTNEVAFPEHMIYLDDYDTSKMVALTIEYENIALDNSFLPSASDFQAFTIDGKLLKRVDQQDGQDQVTQGRTGVTKIFFELPILGQEFNELELDFVPSNENLATFDIPVSH